ncbi:NAD(P)H-hydrate epimerase [Candidatus Berkelbacteria bacterium]|nr:NAD(P)H-hydrate epimerase [Candidatus Berkelbacteria bacterium]
MVIPAVTAKQMSAIDATLPAQLGLEPGVFVENAGVALALAVKELLGTLRGKRVVILVGAGENGADGVAAGRKLAAWGGRPTLLLAAERTSLKPQTLRELERAEQYDLRIFEPGALLPPADLVIDAIVGYRFAGPLRPPASTLAESALRLRVPVLAVDVPSGLDATSGKADVPIIRAEATVAIGYPKAGAVKPFAKNLIGRLFVADVGIPPRVWQHNDLPAPDFSSGPLVELPL